MSTNAGASFLDFFILEAGEYVEQLDGILLRASESGPDAESVQRLARALRGSATMAKLASFAELASSVESVGRALRQGSLGWDAALKGALTAAIDDLKLLVRAARAWSATEDQWAARRVAELSRYAPSGGGGAASAAATAERSGSFFGSEAAAIAAGLEAVVSHSGDASHGAEQLRRLRALRGVAGVRDVPGLSEAAEAAEVALRVLEQGSQSLSPERVSMLRASAELLRAVSQAIAGGSRVTTSTPAYRAYLSALDAIEAHERGGERVIPIAELFFNDAGPHIVESAPNPPTTPGQRFRMEVVSLGEHLHQVIDEARRASDDIQREHARGELARALRAIRATAASFSQLAVAQTVEGHLERTGDLTDEALDGISKFAASISPPPQLPPPVEPHTVPFRMTHARQAVEALGSEPAPGAAGAPPQPVVASQPPRASGSDARVFAAVTAPARPARPAPAAPAAPAAAAPSAMDDAIAAFDSLSVERMAEPVALGDDAVPIDALLYRGQAALARAIELRDALRRAGGPPAPELLEELYDLLDLARVPEPAF